MTKGKMKTSFDGLVKLLAKSLYTEPNVFIRELIQNAHDAITLRRAQGDKVEGRIDIAIDSQASVISFRDNGTGMSDVEIENYLTTIGISGSDTQASQLTADTIGQFGIGLLSAFVVAKSIELTTRKPGGAAFLWRSSGGEDYELIEIDTAEIEPGTVVKISVEPTGRLYIEEKEVRETIRRYADFLPYRIYLNGDGPVNHVDAPWHRPRGAYSGIKDYIAKLRDFLEERYDETPLHIIPIDLSKPRARGALYISDRHIPDINTTGVIDIFQQRMCIRLNDQDLLPIWAKFVRGIVDSPDLQPTAARDAIIRNDVYYDIRRQLGALLVTSLTTLSTEEPERFFRICRWHHYHLKGMALRYDSFFNSVAELLPFDTNDGEMNLKTYVRRQRRTDNDVRIPIYFFSYGMDSNQFYDVAQAQGILALNTGKVFEEEFVRKYVEGRADRLELRQLDVLDDKELYAELSEEERQPFLTLETAVERATGEAGITLHVRTRRFKPSTMSGAILRTERLQAMEKLKQLADQAANRNSAFDDIAREAEREMRAKPLDFFLNADNGLIRRLRDRSDIGSAHWKDLLVALYNAAIMNSQHHLTPENARIFYAQMHRQIEGRLDLEMRQASLERELEEARERQAAMGLLPIRVDRDWIKLFVMMPYEKKYDVLEQALQTVFEADPYWFEVQLARDRAMDNTMRANIRQHVRESDGYIAEIGTFNPNVMMELGWVHFEPSLEKRPTFVLWNAQEADESQVKLPEDLGGLIRIERPLLSSEELVNTLKSAFEIHDSVRRLMAARKARYLPASYLESTHGFSSGQAKLIVEHFRTFEALEVASFDNIANPDLADLARFARRRIFGRKNG